MTNKEAKEWLSPKTSPMKIYMSELNGENPINYINQAIKVAITALDKQINQKPAGYNGCNFTYHCSSCNKLLYWTDEPRNHGKKTNYCPNCGQKLDWSDKE